MIRTQTWARRRMGDAGLPPGWAMGPGGTPYFVSYASQTLLVRDAQGNTVAIPAGPNAANWTAAQNAVNAGTMTLSQVAAQYGGTPPFAPPPGITDMHICPAWGCGAPPAVPVQIVHPVTTAPAGEPIDLGAAPSSTGFSFSSIPTWGYVAAGIGLLFLFRK